MDEIITRIKEVRQSLNLSQDDFAESLNLKRNSISLIETYKRNPSERTILDICREFNVNEDWLRTGVGEMFHEVIPEDEFYRAAAELTKEDDTLMMGALVEYWKLDKDGRKLLNNFLLHTLERLQKEEQE